MHDDNYVQMAHRQKLGAGVQKSNTQIHLVFYSTDFEHSAQQFTDFIADLDFTEVVRCQDSINTWYSQRIKKKKQNKKNPTLYDYTNI